MVFFPLPMTVTLETDVALKLLEIDSLKQDYSQYLCWQVLKFSLEYHLVTGFRVNG